ncbi:MAG: EF-Tu/IF-2/RF-3 family GTPase, partial [Candidatus Hodarchaeota archaeon]
NPKEAQNYRIEKIWDGDINSEVGRAMKNCDPNGPLIICLSKVQVDKQNLVATGRIFSGVCSKKEEIFLLRENDYATIQRTAIFMGQRREQVEKVLVGNIVAIEGLKKIRSGETIVDSQYIDKMIPFEEVKYVTTPVVTVSVEPEYLRDLDKMRELIENLLIEDPNLRFEINEENGEFLLSGMGPLHLEVTAKEIEKRGVTVSISEPRAVFKESCRYDSSIITINSPNNQNSLSVRIERLDPKTVRFLQTINIKSFKPVNVLENILLEKTNLTENEIQNFWIFDDDQNLLTYNKKDDINAFYKEIIIESFKKLQLNGPLCNEKLTELKVIIENLTISNLNEENAFTELSALFYEAIKRALNEAELILLEPIYHSIIQLPPEHIKSVLTLLTKYSAKIKNINQDKEYQAILEILIPVRNSIRFAEDIRSATSGRAFWQNEFYSFMEVPDHEASSIISNLRFIKGLSW